MKYTLTFIHTISQKFYNCLKCSECHIFCSEMDIVISSHCKYQLALSSARGKITQRINNIDDGWITWNLTMQRQSKNFWINPAYTVFTRHRTALIWTRLRNSGRRSKLSSANSKHGQPILCRMPSRLLLRIFRNPTVPDGFVLATTRFNFENCYNTKKVQQSQTATLFVWLLHPKQPCGSNFQNFW